MIGEVCENFGICTLQGCRSGDSVRPCRAARVPRRHPELESQMRA